MKSVSSLLLFALCVGGVPYLPVSAEDGAEEFIKDRSNIARLAERRKDYKKAERAWSDILEISPLSQRALQGLVDVAEAQGDRDGELLALLRLSEELQRAAAREDPGADRLLTKAEERRSVLDPLAGDGERLLADYAETQEFLGETYLADEFYANALAAWKRRGELAVPYTEAAEKSKNAIRTILVEGGDDVAVPGLDPSILNDGRSEEWIAKHDRAHDEWGDAAIFELPHYVLKTNAGWRIGSAAAEAMERAHGFFREVWGLIPDPPPKKVDKSLRDIQVSRIEVGIYRNKEEYLQQTGSPEWSGGVYTGGGVYTWDYTEQSGATNFNSTFGTLFHEASHQFMAECVGGVPSFVNEGVACLFEGIEMLSNGTIRKDLPVLHYLTELAEELEGEGTLSLREVMDGTSAASNQPEYYKYRWGVMYFLRMFVDDQGIYVYRDRLTDFIYSFKQSSGGKLSDYFEEYFFTGKEAPVVEGLDSLDSFRKFWGEWILDLNKEIREEDKRVDEYRQKGRMAYLKKNYGESMNFYSRAQDIDPDDVETAWGLARAAEKLDRSDRAVFEYRRFLDIIERTDTRFALAEKAIRRLDPYFEDYEDAQSALIGGMAVLGQRYDKEGLPLMAMYWGHRVLELDPFDGSARSLVDRLERETGRSVVLWQRLFNGFDLHGWYSGGGMAGFTARGGALVCDSALMEGLDDKSGADQQVYRTLFVQRQVGADWTLDVKISGEKDWQIAGLCFGAQDEDRFEGIVLRHTGDKVNNVDFATFDGDSARSFRGDGSYKAPYNLSDGVTVRLQVRGKKVAVFINGELLKPIVDGREVEWMKYPMAALRGDIGILASEGVTRFTDIRLLSR
ncbi:MAG: hypothetical protein VX916_03740 [Planctomycetota bacterium]|nr:hypothetical protein [Planctomycetota bacterium]